MLKLKSEVENEKYYAFKCPSTPTNSIVTFRVHGGRQDIQTSMVFLPNLFHKHKYVTASELYRIAPENIMIAK